MAVQVVICCGPSVGKDRILLLFLKYGKMLEFLGHFT